MSEGRVDPLRRGIFLALLSLSGFVAGCSARSGPVGPVVSPTGIVYEPGVPPRESRLSQTARLYLRGDNNDRALQLVLEGIEADSANPIHYYLAGTAYARLGDEVAAGEMFAVAERLYPAYQLDIEPERERAWAIAFNEGIEAFDEGDVDRAIEAWNRAALIYDLRPEAHRNLAALLGGEGRYEEAIEAYQRALSGLERRPATRVLPDDEVAERAELGRTMEGNLAQLLLFTARFAEAEPVFRRHLEEDPDNVERQRDLARVLTGLERHEEATEIYTVLFESDALSASELFNLGVSLFRAGGFVQAGRAFERLTELQPDSRDAWFNYTNSLFAAEEWQLLTAAGQRLTELDPLSEDAALITARAHLEIGDEDSARLGLEGTEAMPVYLEGLRLRASEGETVVEGSVVGNTAEPGAGIQIRFIFHGESGVLGTEVVSLYAPNPESVAAFDVSFPERASGYRYELLP